MSETSREIRKDLISAGKKAARELIAVAKEKIVHKDMSKDPLAADKMKTAAAAKKVAIFDGFDILDRCELEELKLSNPEKKKEPKGNVKNENVDFKSVEERTT